MSDREQESSFYSFMGFESDFAREVRAFYLPFFEGCGEVLDVACGRGEFMDVLREAGIGARGVDIDPGMVRAARQAGHDVQEADVFSFLEGRTGAFDGIFSAHLVEHLTYEQTMGLLRLAFAALRPGGRIAICTPNAASLPTLQHQFWWDATHVRMYDVELLRFMVAEAGFEQVEGGVNPRNQPIPIDVKALEVPPLDPIPLRRLSSLWPSFRYLERRTQVMSHHLSVVSGSLRKLIEELYVPCEMFVAARRGRA